jgi:hypothetical protein
MKATRFKGTLIGGHKGYGIEFPHNPQVQVSGVESWPQSKLLKQFSRLGVDKHRVKARC